MKKALRYRFYCDFCKKSGGSGGHMKKHEAGCTANPIRRCGMCFVAWGPEEMVVMKEFQAKVSAGLKHCTEWWGEGEWSTPQFSPEDECGKAMVESLKWLDEKVKGCPACKLAMIRQSKFTYFLTKDYFDFKVEKQEWWRDHPRSDRQFVNCFGDYEN